ncbi:MAG TPA: glycosyltransferase family 4 protein [Gemmatimonadales bacterium]|nr:glycosyltransferase family 4 protein [Gemmatimonadales bacterium]
MMGEIALRYPRNTLVVSTGAYEGSAASDARFPQIIDRVGIRATRLRTVQGLALWTWRAGALAKQRRPGFVWCAELKPAGYPARWLAARHRVPYGLIVYGSELLLIQEKIRRSRFKRGTAASIIGNAAVVVAISRWTADLALDVLAMLDLRVPVESVPLGTTPAHFRPGVDTSAVRAKYGLNGGPWLLTVARLEWHKGIDTTMKALAAVRAAHPGTRYAIVGTGERLAQFEQLRDELRLGDAVRFLGGISDAELPAIYNAADLYVGASRRFEGLAEGFGISLVEASGCGLAVVGGRSGGVPDAVRDGETGILVDPDDPRAVAAGINRLLADPERRERLGAAGRKAVESYYNWDRVVRDLIEIDGRFRSTE